MQGQIRHAGGHCNLQNPTTHLPTTKLRNSVRHFIIIPIDLAHFDYETIWLKQMELFHNLSNVRSVLDRRIRLQHLVS